MNNSGSFAENWPAEVFLLLVIVVGILAVLAAILYLIFVVLWVFDWYYTRQAKGVAPRTLDHPKASK